MNWNEYSALALRTESIPENYYSKINPKIGYPAGLQEWKPHENATRLLHAAMGLVTETDELEDHKDRINLVEEIGDCFWYLPIIQEVVPEFNIQPILMARLDIGTANYNLRECRRYASALIDLVGKRHIFYGKELDTKKLLEVTESYVYYLVRYCACMQIKLEDAWEANIKKLEKRYPDLRFDGEQAVNRDVDNELSHINPEDPVSPEQIVKENWELLKSGVPTNLAYDSDPEDVAAIVLHKLGCTEEYARQVLGEEFERCRFTIVHDGHEDTFLTAVPIKFSSGEPTLESALINIMDPVTPPLTEDYLVLRKEELQASGFNSILRNDFTPNEIERISMGLAFELGQQFKKRGMDCLATAMGEVYRNYSARGDKLQDNTVFGMYEMLGYPLTVEGVLAIAHSILRKPFDGTGNNSSAG